MSAGSLSPALQTLADVPQSWKSRTTKPGQQHLCYWHRASWGADTGWHIPVSAPSICPECGGPQELREREILLLSVRCAGRFPSHHVSGPAEGW